MLKIVVEIKSWLTMLETLSLSFVGYHSGIHFPTEGMFGNLEGLVKGRSMNSSSFCLFVSIKPMKCLEEQEALLSTSGLRNLGEKCLLAYNSFQVCE